jgi:hypothetical protein
VRQIGAALGRQAEADQRVIDLAVERGERVVRRDAGPERIDAALLVERADARQRDLDRRRMDMAQREHDILRHAAIDLADIADGQMKLIVVLPARLRHAVHRRGESGADRTGGGRRATNRRCMTLSR